MINVQLQPGQLIILPQFLTTSSLICGNSVTQVAHSASLHQVQR